jgi:hypothetical protein
MKARLRADANGYALQSGRKIRTYPTAATRSYRPPLARRVTESGVALPARQPKPRRRTTAPLSARRNPQQRAGAAEPDRSPPQSALARDHARSTLKNARTRRSVAPGDQRHIAEQSLGGRRYSNVASTAKSDGGSHNSSRAGIIVLPATALLVVATWCFG